MAISLRRSLTALALIAFAGCAPNAASSGMPIDNAVVCNAFAQHRSGIEVDAEGTVTRVLGTRAGRQSPHTGFLVQLQPCDVTVRVEANTDFTGVVPVRRGDDVVLRGDYEYYALGGVIHWTHRDPRGRHPGGYIKVGGTTYQ